MGHAMFVTLQDIMARYNRMRGRPTLWLPGTDHAGIATQVLLLHTIHHNGKRTKHADVPMKGCCIVSLRQGTSSCTNQASLAKQIALLHAVLCPS